jgi:hypothetical protein
MDVAASIPSNVALDPVVAAGNIVSKHLTQFLLGSRAMQAGSYEYEDAVGAQPGLLQCLKERGQQHLVGDGPSDVGDNEAGTRAALRELM